ncbi:MAG TPA: flavin reductase family protein [Candidatus Scatomonas merdavium]|nr:flavin reductase family protein [Candidatus Scatomonas merdavium]
MVKISIDHAPAYTSPNSMTLICTEKPDGSTNLATLAFWAFASTNPGKIMFSLNKGAYSLELLAGEKEVVLAVPGIELAGALIGCGTCSGRDTDKIAKVGLTMQEVEGTNIKAPVPCRLLIHAAVAETMDADDHVVHLCDVKSVYGDEDVAAVFGWKGYAEFAAAQKR